MAAGPDRRESRGVPALLFTALAVAATGGPLALVALYVPAVVRDVRGSAPLLTLAASVVFLAPLLVWVGYSRETADPGGLTTFVREAVGPRSAWVQAAFWLVSYVLYAVYTVSYVAYDLVPAMFPSRAGDSSRLQVVVAVGVAVVLLLPVTAALSVVGLLAVGELLLVAVLVVVAVAHQGAGASGLAPHGSAHDLALGGGNTAILFVCASLPLFLAAEVRGGRRAVRRGLVRGWGLAALATVAGSVPLVAAGASVFDEEAPGQALARAAGGHGLATAVGTGVALSVAGVMVAELLAISRLVHSLTRRPVPEVSRWLAVVLLVGAAVSLVDPLRVYADLLKPSLVALWVAQLMVVAAYPSYVRRRRPLRAEDVGLAAVASIVMLFGLWSTISNQVVS